MMTKQDFQQIAGVFRQRLDVDFPMPEDPAFDGPRDAVIGTLIALANTFATINPRFDRDKFLFAATGSRDLHLLLLEVENA